MQSKAISLTYFIDFIFKTGIPKQTVVKNAMNPKPYNPAQDHWKQLREGIINFHEEGKGSKEKSDLDWIVEHANVRNNKRAHYFKCIKNYKSWLGRKSIEWLPPVSNTLGNTDIKININPEIGLIENGNPILIKFFFKELDYNLRKDRAGVILAAMEAALRDKVNEKFPEYPHVRLGLLDIRNGNKGKLFESGNIKVEDFNPLVKSELLGFNTIWKELMN